MNTRTHKHNHIAHKDEMLALRASGTNGEVVVV